MSASPFGRPLGSNTRNPSTPNIIQPEGTCYIWSYSGFMLTEPQAIGGYVINVDGLRLHFDEPRRAAPPTWRPIPQLTPHNVNLFLPGMPATIPLRMAVLPSVDAEGKPSLQSIWGDDQPVENLPKDTFPILVSGDGHAERGVNVAESSLKSAFSWLRILTKQWWLGRPSEALTGNMHFVIPMASGGRVMQPPYVTGQATTPSRGTRRVSREIWIEALRKVESREQPDPVNEILANSIYSYFVKEYMNSIILACTIAEIERDRILEASELKKSDLKVTDTDILKQLSKGLGNAIGRNMADEAPTAFAFLRTCWIARGGLAHGKPLVWVVDGKAVPFQDVAAEQFLNGIEAVAGWLRSVLPRV